MTEAVKAPRKVARALNTREQAQAKAMWESGEITLDELAKKFGRNRTTFVNFFKREGIVKGATKEELQKKIEEEVAKNLVSDASVYAARIKETKDQHYIYADNLAKLSWSIMRKAKIENRSMASTYDEQAAILKTMQVMKIAREERFAVLGINAQDSADDVPLPDLEIHELSANEIKEMHRQQMVQGEDGLDEVADMDIGLGDDELLDNVENEDRVEIDD